MTPATTTKPMAPTTTKTTTAERFPIPPVLKKFEQFENDKGVKTTYEGKITRVIHNYTHF